MSFRSRKVAWVIVALSFVTVSAFAMIAASDPTSTTFKFNALRDTSLSTTSPDTVYGGATVLWVSKSGNAQNWGLISFDVASKLQPTDTVISARIKLMVSQSTGSFPATMTTGRLLGDFSEATTTYNTRPAASFDTITSTLFDKQPGPGKAIFVDVTNQLAAWQQSGQRTPFGVELTMSSGTVNAGIAFASRENTYLEGPVIQIFTLPPGQTVYGYTISLGGLFAVRTAN